MVNDLIRRDLKGSLKTEKIKHASEVESHLNIDQLAQVLQVPKSWIYEKVRTRNIPARKIGKYLIFSPTEINKWLEGCSINKNSKERRL